MSWTEILTLIVSVITALYVGYEKITLAGASKRASEGDILADVGLYAKEMLGAYAARVAALQARVAELEHTSAERTELINEMEKKITELEIIVQRLSAENNALKRADARRKKTATGSLESSPKP